MVKLNIWIYVSVLLLWSPVLGVRKYTRDDVLQLREEVRQMFTHAYDGYLRHAYPADELRPLSCDGVETWGSYSLTLVDALDTLAIMGNYTEFNRVVQLVLKRKSFDIDLNVSVFETNIRIVGGLLSAHLLSHKTGIDLEPGWPCNGPLLRLAEDVARRLAPAFDTRTGMPYGTVNLRTGVPRGETAVTCAAGVGTFLVEFGTLSRLTGDPLYEELAYNAMIALYNHRSSIGLLGNHIDVQTGRWTAQDAGIGGGVDSYYEYLVKGAILLERPELMSIFTEMRTAVERHLRKEDWHVWATMLKGHVSQPVFQSLEAYWPGLLSLVGDSNTAMRILHNYHSVWRQYGFTPEVYRLGAGEAAGARESYPLRPELIESIMYLYRDTRDPALLQMGEDILRSIQHSAKTSCGYATIKDVRDHRKEDRMESFFLAETTKYLYLLFDPDNFIHNPGSDGELITTPNGECLIDLGGYVFNTEAHPVDPAILHCCHQARNGLNLTEVHRMYQVLEDEDNIKLRSATEEDPDRRPKTHQKNVTVANTVKHQNISEYVNSMIALSFTSGADVELITLENSKEEIKTESKADYVNIDGTERKKAESSDMTNLLKENDIKLKEDYIDTVKAEAKAEANSSVILQPVEVEVAPNRKPEPSEVLPPSTSKAKEMFRLLPAVLQEYLSGDARAAACEPQHMLERIRREHRYATHPHAGRYELLLTPAPHFLQRVTLAGEVLELRPTEA